MSPFEAFVPTSDQVSKDLEEEFSHFKDVSCAKQLSQFRPNAPEIHRYLMLLVLYVITQIRGESIVESTVVRQLIPRTFAMVTLPAQSASSTRTKLCKPWAGQV